MNSYLWVLQSVTSFSNFLNSDRIEDSYGRYIEAITAIVGLLAVRSTLLVVRLKVVKRWSAKFFVSRVAYVWCYLAQPG